MIRKLRALIYLYRRHRNITLIKDYKQSLRLIRRDGPGPGIADVSKHSILRNLYASVIKQLRAKEPYEVLDFSKARKLYEDYFKMENHIPSYNHLKLQVKAGKEVFVVKFRGEAPIKGSRFNDYYMNSSFDDLQKIYKLKLPSNERYDYLEMYTPNGLSNVKSIDKDFFTSYRYATREEIENFKISEIQCNGVKQRLEINQRQQQKLHEQLSQLVNSKPINV